MLSTLLNEANLDILLGPVVRVSPDEVAISDISAAKEIHKVGARFLKGRFYDGLGDRKIKNLFSTRDTRHHAIRRKLLSAPQSESSIKPFGPIVLARVHLCIQRMTEELKTRGTIDVYKWWTFLATDVIGELSFGDSFRMLEIGKVRLVHAPQRK